MKQTVEAMLRDRGVVENIIWRDNDARTIKQVYDWLVNNPEWKPESNGAGTEEFQINEDTP